jgi:MFS family permease
MAAGVLAVIAFVPESPIKTPTRVDVPDAAGGAVDYGFGSSATQAGLFLLPGALIGFFSGPLAGRLGSKHGFRFPLVLGMVLGAFAVMLLAEWHHRPWQVVVAMSIAGGAVPLTFAAMAKLVVDAVRPSETGVSTGLNTVVRVIGGVVGSQLAATILENMTIAGSAVPTASAYATAFWISAVVAVFGVVTALAVTPRRRGRLAMAMADD